MAYVELTDWEILEILATKLRQRGEVLDSREETDLVCLRQRCLAAGLSVEAIGVE